MDTTKLREEVEQAKRVYRLNNQFLDAFFDEKEAALIREFKALAVGSSDELIEIHHKLSLLAELKAEIDSVVNTGKMAKIMLDNAKQ